VQGSSSIVHCVDEKAPAVDRSQVTRMTNGKRGYCPLELAGMVWRFGWFSRRPVSIARPGIPRHCKHSVDRKIRSMILDCRSSSRKAGFRVLVNVPVIKNTPASRQSASLVAGDTAGNSRCIRNRFTRASTAPQVLRILPRVVVSMM